MGEYFRVDRRVFAAFQAASSGSDARAISAGGPRKRFETALLEAAIAADGQVDPNEAALLDALARKAPFALEGTSDSHASSQTATHPLYLIIDPAQLSYSRELPDYAAGTRLATYADGRVRAVPAHVPVQFRGRQTNFYAAAETDFSLARRRLLAVDSWEQAAPGTAAFRLMDSAGRPKAAPPVPGDFVRIKLPIPGGYDWVRVEQIIDHPDLVSITLRPSRDPGTASAATAHFFTSSATNTISLETGDDGQVRYHVNGRNEVANSGTLNALIDIGSVAGDYLPFIPGQKDQWEWLGHYLLSDD